MTTHYSTIKTKVSAPDEVVDDMSKEAELSDAVEKLKETIETLCRHWVEAKNEKFGPLQVDVTDE